MASKKSIPESSMKKAHSILLVLLVTLLSLSCNKEAEERPNYYYRFKVNGVQKEFSANTNASIGLVDDVNSGLFLAFLTMVTGNDGDKNAIVISLRTERGLLLDREYTMQEEITFQGKVSPTIAAFYLNERGKAFDATKLQKLYPGAEDDFIIKFTAFYPESIYGNFEGVLFDSSESGDLGSREPLYITEGKFYLPKTGFTR
jgi:hypothetical protein